MAQSTIESFEDCRSTTAAGVLSTTLLDGRIEVKVASAYMQLYRLATWGAAFGVFVPLV